MSEQQQGPGWWLASDGKWYPPDQAPAVPPPETWSSPPVGPPRTGMSSGGKVALVLTGVLALVALIGGALFLARDSDDDDAGATDTTEATETTDATETTETTETTEVDSIALPDGFARIEGDGVSIGAPATWGIVDPADAALSAEQFADLFPDLEPELIQQMVDGLDQGALLIAFEMTGAGDSVNIQGIPGEAPFPALESQVPAQLERLGAEAIETSIVDTELGEALRLEYTLDVTMPDGSPTTTYGVQYYLPLAGHTYVVTISGTSDMAAQADQMIDTFRVD